MKQVNEPGVKDMSVDLEKLKAVAALRMREEYKLDDLTDGSIYLDRKGRLAKRIDFAWAAYKNDKVPRAHREAAFNFLIYAFDLNDLSDLNNQLLRLMEDRKVQKKEDQDYVPGKSLKNKFSPEELLVVDESSKIIDKSKNTFYLNSIERAEQRVIIHGGIFKKDGHVFDTRDMISHNKPGYAAFTLTAPYGELSVFSHKAIAKGRIAHSSMNAGRPVLAAGEIKIENGVITAISTHSGHYKPSLFSIYHALEHFSQNGVTISNIRVMTLNDPSKYLSGSQSQIWNSPNGPYYVTPVEEIYKNIKSLINNNINSIDREVKSYNNGGWLRFLFCFKDKIMGTNLTELRMELAKEFESQLTLFKTGLASSSITNRELAAKIDELKTLIEQYQQKNNALSKTYEKEAGSGRLGTKLTLFGQNLNKVKSESKEQSIESLKASH